MTTTEQYLVPWGYSHPAHELQSFLGSGTAPGGKCLYKLRQFNALPLQKFTHPRQLRSSLPSTYHIVTFETCVNATCSRCRSWQESVPTVFSGQQSLLNLSLGVKSGSQHTALLDSLLHIINSTGSMPVNLACCTGLTAAI